MKHCTFFTRDERTHQSWTKELKPLEEMWEETSLKHWFLVDANLPDWRLRISTLDRAQTVLFLVISELDMIPAPEDLEKVDDVLVFPFRLMEVVSRMRAQQQKANLQELIQSTQKDVFHANEVLERIVQAKTPRPFKDIKGINIMSRHLAGLKPGGDYFDVFETEKKEWVNILLADSSSYGVSSALLGMILSSSAKIATDAQLCTADWIRAIHDELKVTLGENEHLSVFYGRLNRRDFSLHYQLFGSIEAFVVEKTGDVHPLDKHGTRMTAKQEPRGGFENVIHLDPKDRLVLLSDGFVNGVGGEFALQKLFHDKLGQEPFTLVTELAYQIKSKLVEGEVFPGEDCTAIVLDIEGRVLRLAPTG